jgi:hypothetical protein
MIRLNVGCFHRGSRTHYSQPKEILVNNNRRVLKSGMAIGLVCFILFTPTLSQGWGAGGHMMVAQIAFSRLNPKAKAQVNMLLAIEIKPADVSKNSKDFVNAAHWADDLRPFAEFDPLKPFHFIDQPFSTDGTALPAGVPEPDNIVKALEDNVNILKTSTDKNAQALALRLIIHFVGDIHQPLHCATRVSSALPEGDRGGNLVSIKIPGSDGKLKTTNLHSFWDGGIGSFPPSGANFAPPPLSQIPAAAAKAKRGNPATDPALKLDDPFNFSAWADESFALAKDVAYKNIENGGQPSAAYKKASLKVVRKRVAWGGYRLAALLNAIWPE